MITAALGTNLLRMKGIVNIAGEERPAVIHGVNTFFILFSGLKMA